MNVLTPKGHSADFFLLSNVCIPSHYITIYLRYFAIFLHFLAKLLLSQGFIVRECKNIAR